MAAGLSAVAAHPNLSHALQGPHDSSISAHLPLLFGFGFISSFVCGILNFGEAITFTMLWNFARYMSWLDADVTFQKGVVFSQVGGLSFCAAVTRMSQVRLTRLFNADIDQVLALFTVVPVIFAGWREVLCVVGYSCLMLAVLTHVRMPLLLHFRLVCFK